MCVCVGWICVRVGRDGCVWGGGYVCVCGGGGGGEEGWG